MSSMCREGILSSVCVCVCVCVLHENWRHWKPVAAKFLYKTTLIKVKVKPRPPSTVSACDATVGNTKPSSVTNCRNSWSHNNVVRGSERVRNAAILPLSLKLHSAETSDTRDTIHPVTAVILRWKKKLRNAALSGLTLHCEPPRHRPCNLLWQRLINLSWKLQVRWAVWFTTHVYLT